MCGAVSREYMTQAKETGVPTVKMGSAFLNLLASYLKKKRHNRSISSLAELLFSVAAKEFFHDLGGSYNYDEANQFCKDCGGWLAIPESAETWSYMKE